MSATLKDIANKISVSVSTVSRVVNGKKYVKPETRKKILKALKDMDYTPNQVARSLKIKSTNTIGVVIPDINEDFFSYVFKGLNNILDKNGYSVILCDTEENEKKEEIYLNLLTEKRIDGIVLATVSKNNKTLNKLLESGLPVIFIDNLPNIKNNFDSVIIDNEKASCLAVEHLLEFGHKRIGIITGKTNETTGYERLSGYKKALKMNNIDIHKELIKIGDFKEESGYKNMNELLKDDKITSVYIASSKMTYGAIKAIRENNLKIPEDISVVGFDVHDPSGLIKPSITTIIQPEKHKRINNPKSKYRQKIVLDPEIIAKDSTCHIKYRK